jgi:long-chain acyl-CoA synthetase
MPISYSSSPSPSGSAVPPSAPERDHGYDYDPDGGPVLVAPETRRLNGEVREAYVPPLVSRVTHGSLADLPFENAAADPARRVLSRRAAGGGWTHLTAQQFADQVRSVAQGLIAEGLMPGDRIAVMARTTYEWTLLDFAAWAAGLVTVPVYPTSSLFQTRWILQDSGAVALVTETAGQAAALGPERDRLLDLRHIWVVEQGHVDRLAEAGATVPDQEVDVRRGMLGPDTLATLVYTSGTTGRPKGCALTHRNFLAEVDNAIELLYPVFKGKESDEPATLLFQPLSHVFGRMVAVACVRAGVRLGHAPSLRPEDLLTDLASFRPTFLLAIPYMLEKIYNNARATAERSGRASSFDRAGVLEDPAGLEDGGGRVDGHGDQTGRPGREVEQGPLVGGAGHDGDPVAGRQPLRDQPAGHGVHLGGEAFRRDVGPVPVRSPAAEDHRLGDGRRVVVGQVGERAVRHRAGEGRQGRLPYGAVQSQRLGFHEGGRSVGVDVGRAGG